MYQIESRYPYIFFATSVLLHNGIRTQFLTLSEIYIFVKRINKFQNRLNVLTEYVMKMQYNVYPLLLYTCLVSIDSVYMLWIICYYVPIPEHVFSITHNLSIHSYEYH